MPPEAADSPGAESAPGHFHPHKVCGWWESMYIRSACLSASGGKTENLRKFREKAGKPSEKR
jgi:hypothetical protein